MIVKNISSSQAFFSPIKHPLKSFPSSALSVIANRSLLYTGAALAFSSKLLVSAEPLPKSSCQSSPDSQSSILSTIESIAIASGLFIGFLYLLDHLDKRHQKAKALDLKM